MSRTVTCPHCGNPMVDDGKLAGQLVGCPFCLNQFLMGGPPPLPKRRRSTLYGRFNVLHYLIAAAVGLFIGTFGGCSIGWRMIGAAAVSANPDGFATRLFGNIGAAAWYFGPFVGVSLALCILRSYDLNRRR